MSQQLLAGWSLRTEEVLVGHGVKEPQLCLVYDHPRLGAQLVAYVADGGLHHADAYDPYKVIPLPCLLALLEAAGVKALQDAKPLQDALQAEANRLDGYLDKLRSMEVDGLAETALGVGDEIYESVSQLRLGIVLIRVLKRLVGHATLRQIHEAFGAPGDFGYESRLGQALYRLYQGKGTPTGQAT